MALKKDLVAKGHVHLIWLNLSGHLREIVCHYDHASLSLQQCSEKGLFFSMNSEVDCNIFCNDVKPKIMGVVLGRVECNE